MNSHPWGKPPERRRASRLGVIVWMLVMAGLLLGVWGLSAAFPQQSSPLQDVFLWRTVAIIALSSAGLLFVRDMNLKTVTRNILIWTGIAGVLMIGFTYQDELRGIGVRLRSDLILGYAVETNGHEMMLTESAGGGYFVYGTVNGAPVKFLVDTGASDIVLSPGDALRAGIDLDNLKFDRSYESANGIGKGAKIRLDSLTVGNIMLSNVDVSVDKAAMSSSLLGMSFLRRMKSFGFSDRKLILRW